jgi:hypothetical protein
MMAFVFMFSAWYARASAVRNTQGTRALTKGILADRDRSLEVSFGGCQSTIGQAGLAKNHPLYPRATKPALQARPPAPVTPGLQAH